MKKLLLIGFLGFLNCFCLVEGTHAQQGCGFSYKREFVEPDAFEKVYVKGSDLLYTHAGIFLKHSCGSLEQVRSICHDCKGMYAVRIHTQCPLCGRVYSGRESPDGLNCPLYSHEVVPGIWE